MTSSQHPSDQSEPVDPLAGIEMPDDATRPEPPHLDEVTAAQKQPGRYLKLIHDQHRSNLARVREALQLAQDGELTPDAHDSAKRPLEGLDHNYRKFGALCGRECQFVHGHHSAEDALLFPALSEKAAAFRHVIQRLQDEHDVVHALLMRMLEQLEALQADPSPAQLVQAQKVYDALETVLLSHFSYEERSIGDAIGVFDVGV